MTLEEFQALSFHDREVFLESGGTISTKDASKKEGSDESLKRCDKCVVDSSLVGNLQQGPSVESLSEAKEAVRTVDVSTTEGSPAVSFSNPEDNLCFQIEDPVELLFLLDDNIASGKVTLHPWQIQFLLDFAVGGGSDSQPFQAVMRACNGSGKDKYIIAPCVVWLCMRFFRARGVITSSSGVQLDNQTCAYVDQLCESANRKFGLVWKTNYRYYECLATQSPIICYATDEPGKAEGFHPLEFNAKMAILVSEDKSVPDDINIALNKCTGYTHRCHVSTPGNAFGHFFDLCSTGINRSDIDSVKEVKAEDYIHYHVTANMCPHLSSSYIRQMKRDLPGGENGPAYASQVKAEFAVTDEMVVIPYTYIWKAKKVSLDKWIPEEHNKAGLDLSDGGDETVLCVRNGNRLLDIVPFRFDNTEDTVTFLNEKFKEHKLCHKDALIFADCGGLGKPILDRMKRQGWSNIRYRDNRAKTTRPKTYKNWGAESWFHFGDLLKRGEIILIDDNLLSKQLSTRYFKIIDGAIHQLLSKIEMRSRNLPSPDRADACVLAFSDYQSTFVVEIPEDEDKPFKVEEEEKKVTGDFVLKSWAENQYGRYRGKYTVNGGQKDWSEIQEQITENNKQLKLAQKL